MKLPIILVIFSLFIVYLVPSLSVIDFQYKCAGTDATATTYSYLREPRVEDTGYTHGLKSGSFNYLENGEIDLEETITYDYGNNTNISNSSVNHVLNVDFKGDRGISEFFAKGFFDNNRWISAWKKIRYEESPSVKIDGKAMKNRPSKEIKVVASARMDTFNKTNPHYNFNYNAQITNGTIEVKDSTGWTNKTGSRQFDWEYEAFTSGQNLDITNILSESEGPMPAGGLEGDWLPCCYSGTLPPVDQLDDQWPSNVMNSALRANRILPTTQLSSIDATYVQSLPNGISITNLAHKRTVATKHAVVGNIGLVNETMPLHTQTTYIPYSLPREISASNNSRIMAGSASMTYPESRNLKVGLVTYLTDAQLGPITSNTSHKVKSCEDGSCDGYECIYTYDDEVTAESSTDVGGITLSAARAAGELPRTTLKNIDVSLEIAELKNNSTARFFRANGTESPSLATNLEMYKIMVHNSGTVQLTDVVLTAELSKGIKYEASKYYEAGRGDVVAIRDPNPSIEEIKTIVTWNLNTMEPGEIKSILLEANVKKRWMRKGLALKLMEKLLMEMC